MNKKLILLRWFCRYRQGADSGLAGSQLPSFFFVCLIAGTFFFDPIYPEPRPELRVARMSCQDERSEILASEILVTLCVGARNDAVIFLQINLRYLIR